MTSFLDVYFRRNSRSLLAWLVLAGLLAYFIHIHPRGASIGVFSAWANQGTALAFLAVGQTIVVLSRGVDLSIGPIMALTNCLASHLVNGGPLELAFGIAVVVMAGAICGAINGIIVVFGKIQPIIATLATGAIYSGMALIIRPIPGGQIDETLSELVTGDMAGLVPNSVVVLLALVCLFWLPGTRTMLGRSIVAVGSSEQAAYMSGLRVDRAKIAAYALAGIFAAFSGLFIGFQTLSGDPSIGLPYTLNSIAAVVIGGTALTGGAGSVFASIAGALTLRTIGSLIFFTGLPPLAQPLFEGTVLLIAVAFGATRLLRINNRLEAFR
jgi:ribose transport system permease protein